MTTSLFQRLLPILLPTPVCPLLKAWGVYCVFSFLLVFMYAHPFFSGTQDPQEEWDRQAEWLGPAEAVATVRGGDATTYLLDMEESGIQDLLDRLGCRPMTQEEERDYEDRWLEYELKVERKAQVGAMKDKYISDGYFYLLDPEVEAESADATPEERTRRHNSLSLQYRLARLEGEGPGNLLLSTWTGPLDAREEDLPEAKPIQPVHPEYHQQRAYPEWVYKTCVIGVAVLFGIGMNFIGNGFVALLGGPIGWFRTGLWFLLPLVGWGGYLVLLFLWFTFLSINGGVPALFVGALAFGVLAVLVVGVSLLLSLIGYVVARIRYRRSIRTAQ